MLSTSLRDGTIELLRNRPVWLTLKLICNDTTIPEGWLKALVQGKIKGPDVNRIETLNNYLQVKISKVK